MIRELILRVQIQTTPTSTNFYVPNLLKKTRSKP